VNDSTNEVRSANEDDLEALNNIHNHYVRTSHVTFDVDPTSMAWRRRWFEEHAADRHRVFVAIHNGDVVGYASSSRYRAKSAYETTVETIVCVAPGFIGRRVGASLYAVTLDALEPEDVHTVRWLGSPSRTWRPWRSRRFGFELVAFFSEQGRKFGGYWDVDWYERAIG
jgi:phosphinothricin acetyltransferase